MKSVLVLTILCVAAPAIAAAQDGRGKTAPASRMQRSPAPADVVAPGVLRQDLFDRNNPRNLRRDYPAPMAQPGQF